MQQLRPSRMQQLLFRVPQPVSSPANQPMAASLLRRNKSCLLDLVVEARVQRVSILCLLLFMAWQVLAVVHLVATPHVLCPEHGAVTHTDLKGAPSHHQSSPLGSACPVLAVLTHAIPLGDSASPELIHDSPGNCTLCPMPLEDLVQRRGRDLYRLSPSHSPPVVLVAET